MNDAVQPNSRDELPGDLRAAIQVLKHRPFPAESMQRALERAEHCGIPTRATAHRGKKKALLGFAAAVVVCLTLAIWFLRPSNAWAEVVKAVRDRPWIHGTLRDAKTGQSREIWLATSREVGGTRSADLISFFDARLQIAYRYEPEKKVLYRLPTSDADLGQGQQLLEILQALFRGDSKLEAGFPGLILKDQQRKQTEKDGQRWDEYELHFQIPSHQDVDARMTFLVDAQTRLPYSLRMNSDAGTEAEFLFDYPDDGPTDIYTLGVPKEAELVDRVPTGDMSRILAGIQAGRDRFDDFHAIVIKNHNSDSSPGPGNVIPVTYLVWKKGPRWRVDIGISSGAFIRDRLPPNWSKKDWAREGCKGGLFRTLNVCDGKVVYRGNMEGDAASGNFRVEATADQFNSNTLHTMPATWCYPITFPPPNDRTEERVIDKPTAGPPNTILVTSRLVDMRGHDPARTLGFQQFWIDPLRSYAVVQYEAHHADPATHPSKEPGHQQLMDGWEQTPSGIWYPTRVGTGLTSGLKEKEATWYHFFLDFHTEIPDDLFKPTKRTVLTDQYPVGS